MKFQRERPPKEITELFDELKWETDKSWLFGDTGTKENDVWLSKNYVTYEKLSKGYEVTIPVWLAKKVGLY